MDELDQMNTQPDTLPPTAEPFAPPEPEEHFCEESDLPADFFYTLPNGDKHYVSRDHVQSVTWRLESLGYRGPFVANQVEFHAIPRPITEERINWQLLAQERADEARDLKDELAEVKGRIAYWQGEVSVRQATIDELRAELAAVARFVRQ